MTRQEIQALIDAKIKGQGTAVDAGSVLPAILTGILDLIEQGGGGGTADAVQYIPQELTSPQQMQARKNQGLYYSEGGSGDVILTWDGDTTGLESVDVEQEVVMYKVSDDAPQKELVKSLGMTVGGVEQIIDIPQQYIIPIEGGYAIGDSFIIVATESEASFDDYTFTRGIWFVKGGSTGNYVSKITYEATETVHQIPAKYIPSTGLDVFEIKVSQDILYGEPLEVENVTYQDIMDACSAGKYIVLTIMADDDIGVRGRCLGGNFSRMENTGGSIYGQPCYCFAGAYRQHSSGSSGQFGGYSLKDVVLYEDMNDGLLYVELQNCNYNG